MFKFGGNTHGYRRKTVLGGGWPEDCLRVDSDSLTLLLFGAGVSKLFPIMSCGDSEFM